MVPGRGLAVKVKAGGTIADGAIFDIGRDPGQNRPMLVPYLVPSLPSLGDAVIGRKQDAVGGSA